MKLLDAANVNPPDRWAGRWLGGYPGVSRECAAQIEIQQPCPADPEDFDADIIPLIGDVDSTKGNYDVKAFPVRSYLRQSVTCEQDDDKDWFLTAIRNKLDYIVSRALVLETVGGSDTWIGAAGVQTVTLAGTPTPANWQTSIAAARHKWVTTVVSRNAHPLLHVPPSLAPELAAASILEITGIEEVSSIWGDPVVIADGYDDAAAPRVFFSGEVIVRMTGIDEEGGPLYDHRINNYLLETTQFASVDLAPCAIVRVGA